MEIDFLTQKAVQHIEQMEVAVHQISFESHRAFIRHQTDSNNKMMKLKDSDRAKYDDILNQVAIETWRIKHGSKRWHLVQDTAPV